MSVDRQSACPCNIISCVYVCVAAQLDFLKEQQSGNLEILAEDDRGNEYRLQVPYDSTILQG